MLLKQVVYCHQQEGRLKITIFITKLHFYVIKCILILFYWHIYYLLVFILMLFQDVRLGTGLGYFWRTLILNWPYRCTQNIKGLKYTNPTFIICIAQHLHKRSKSLHGIEFYYSRQDKLRVIKFILYILVYLQIQYY
jgi:hypothetical protein